MKKKIQDKSAKICVVGLGYIGLPVACYFAASGFDVKGYDLDSARVEGIKKGNCPIDEKGFDKIFEKALGKLEASDKDAVCDGANAYIICVQTPVRDGKPQLKHLENAFKMVSGKLNTGNLVVVESTVPPGTTKRLWDKLGRDDCFVAHCPERVMPGMLCKEFEEEPRTIGGMREEDAKLAKELYKNIGKGKITLTGLTIAEMVKVVENTYRNTNIALANEIAERCDELGVDAFEVIRMANQHPRVNVHRPGCGVGGNCVPVAPMLLTHGSKVTPSIIKTAVEVNEEMPRYFVEIICPKLGKGGKIIMLGYSYKADSPDTKETPGKIIFDELKEKGFEVLRFDPNVDGMEIGSEEELYKACKGAECIAMVTGHRSFKSLDLGKLKNAMKNALIIDGRGFFNREKVEEVGFEYDGIGV